MVVTGEGIASTAKAAAVASLILDFMVLDATRSRWNAHSVSSSNAQLGTRAVAPSRDVRRRHWTGVSLRCKAARSQGCFDLTILERADARAHVAPKILIGEIAIGRCSH